MYNFTEALINKCFIKIMMFFYGEMYKDNFCTRFCINFPKMGCAWAWALLTINNSFNFETAYRIGLKKTDSRSFI